MKPIVLLTGGTRGDVQPMIALALGLQAAGQTARIAAPPNFAGWVKGFGIPFAAVDGNPSELMMTAGGQSALTFDGNPLRSLYASLAYRQRALPIYGRMLVNALEACRDASALVIGLPSTWGTHVAEALSLPCLGAFLQPVTPTVEFFSPLLPFALNLGKSYHWHTHRVAALATWFPWQSVINRWRVSAGLKPQLTFDFQARLSAVVYGFSEQIVSRPSDWPENVHITGYWTLKTEPPAVDSRLEALQRFIQQGEPPVYIGFGSPGVRQPDEIIRLVVEAVKRAGVRAVFVPPGGNFSLEPSSFLFPLTFPVPHTWLFPKMTALVHHGGAGTTATGLLAGRPALVTPQAVDQFFWGQRIHALGAGPCPIPQRELTVAKLAEGLKLLVDPGKWRSVRQLAEKMKEERGVERAVEIMRCIG